MLVSVKISTAENSEPVIRNEKMPGQRLGVWDMMPWFFIAVRFAIEVVVHSGPVRCAICAPIGSPSDELSVSLTDRIVSHAKRMS